MKLDEAADQNYAQLVWMLRRTQGMFALLPVRSNYSVPTRDALLQRLAGDLPEIPLRIVELSRDSWNAAQVVADAAAGLPAQGAIILLGLEETPGIVPAGGESHRRPPALALLNHEREAIRSHCPHPLVVWCDQVTYRVLKEHAPDFFDHFTGLFSLEEPKPINAEHPPEIPVRACDVLRFSDEAKANLPRGANAALAFYQERLAAHAEPTSERGRALLGLAEALLSLRDRDVPSHLERAERAAAEALSIFSRHEAPSDWARAQLILGLIANAYPRGESQDDTRKAIDHFTKALQEYTEAKFPVEWARTQNNLGIAYASISQGDRADNLQRALGCFTAASRVWTQARFPHDWANTQHNLGLTYANLTTGNRVENLLHAIACYEAGLSVQTESEFPLDWAITQNALGAAYSNLPSGDRDENLRRGIACYDAALRVLGEAALPACWAMTQNNLGFAFAQLSSGNRVENLQQAVAHYEAALRVYREFEFPFEWATTRHNLDAARSAVETLRLSTATR
jgi:tetratricopeptide (TPR) repeat protein